MPLRVKRIIRFVLLTALLLVLVGGVAFWLSGQHGRAALQRWIGQQLVAVANRYLIPQISFADLEYHYPRTVVLKGLRLTADDPASPGGHVDIMNVDRITLELAEIPRFGQPIRIQQLILERPELRFISGGSGKANYIGIDHLLRGPQWVPAQGDPTTQGADTPLSSLFEMQSVQISEGSLLVDLRQPGYPVMRLDQIHTRLNVQSAAKTGGEPGWYALDMKLQRPPVLDIQAAGRLHLDTMTLDLSALKMAVTLGRPQDRYLPPVLQQLLRDHEISGQLTAEGKGIIPCNDWRSSRLDMATHLTDGLIAIGSNRWPVPSLETTCSLANHLGRIDSLKVSMLRGTIQANGQVDLSQTPHAAITGHLDHLRLEQTLRQAKGRKDKYRGDLSGQFTWQANINAIMTGSTGGGEIALVEGRLNGLPVVGQLLDATRQAMKVIGVDSGKDTDTVQAEFSFAGNKLKFSRLDLNTSWAELRGQGDVYFDQRLDLRFKGGPVAKVVSVLGRIGRALTQATDELAEYAIQGTVAKPQIKVVLAPEVRLRKIR